MSRYDFQIHAAQKVHGSVAAHGTHRADDESGEGRSKVLECPRFVRRNFHPRYQWKIPDISRTLSRVRYDSFVVTL